MNASSPSIWPAASATPCNTSDTFAKDAERIETGSDMVEHDSNDESTCHMDKQLSISSQVPSKTLFHQTTSSFRAAQSTMSGKRHQFNRLQIKVPKNSRSLSIDELESKKAALLLQQTAKDLIDMGVDSNISNMNLPNEAHAPYLYTQEAERKHILSAVEVSEPVHPTVHIGQIKKLVQKKRTVREEVSTLQKANQCWRKELFSKKRT
jgi:hypothetical protein